MILGSLEILAEAFTLSEKTGIGSATTYELVKDLFPAPPCALSIAELCGLADSCCSFVNYGNKMVKDAFDGLKGFAIDGGLKDANHVRRLVTEYNSPMPAVVSRIYGVYGVPLSHMPTHLQDVAHGHLLTARAIHQEQSKRGEQAFDVLDWSGLVAGTRVAAGLDAFSGSAQVRAVLPEGKENQS